MPKLEPHTYPAIAFDGVSKRYGATAAIDAVTLEVPHGQFVALVGGSGAGKTTLLKTINALIAPDAGVVRVEGRPTAEVEPPELRRGIGYVFQEIGLFPHLTVARNIAITPRLLGWSEADIAARVAELLDLVALPREFAARKPDALSGGQRQRVGVARALAARPKVMLMDEPFGALDPVTRAALGEDYRRLHETLNLTTVMVTHDVMEAALLADRIVVMKAGAVVADDTPRALLAGHADPDVAAMMQTPRRQAERIEALIHG
ncbi:osmoprotectant transport system ATP-binding protein [Caulobacter ginsengisoli]|uniref:Osmoprotectant transport system ATP-binding protein n=1 Tax=Caulobacter ginsengisoli TaxID=400775 RepID=A0ABU0IK56_9CAUL|nr:ATP-binding cassette domain-containing protein [Caulobacter ginsengisoli]MDQ0462393.1 osmoprotectant transport system ATP-binding protein [Caulobacter ginsengisoli]